MKIGTLLLKFDYGKPERGISMEYNYFYPALKSFAEVVPFWIEDYPIKDLQEEIIRFCKSSRCDYYFTILMYDEITVHTLDRLKEAGHKVINWFCDDHWRLPWSLEVVKHLYGAITVDKYSLAKYKALGHLAWLSQWGIHSWDSPSTLYKYDVAFVGGKNPVREWFVEELKSSGYEVECFGEGWRNGRVTDMSNIFRHSRINLNLSNSIQTDVRCINFVGEQTGGKLGEQIKARHFEIPGGGGFQLAHYALEIEDYFVIGKEIAVFGNIDDLKKQVAYYIENWEEREAIKMAGWRRVRNYTYENRLREVFSEICNRLV